MKMCTKRKSCWFFLVIMILSRQFWSKKGVVSYSNNSASLPREFQNLYFQLVFFIVVSCVVADGLDVLSFFGVAFVVEC